MRKMLIRVPQDQTAKGAILSYEMFVRHLCDTDERFTSNAVGIRAAVRIEQTITPGAHIVEEGDLALLTAAAENPTRGYPELRLRDPSGAITTARFSAARACLPFIDAIAAAVPCPENGAASQEPPRQEQERSRA